MTMPGLSNGYHSQWRDDGISAFEFTARENVHPRKRSSGVSSGHSVSNGYSSDPQSDPGSEDGPTYLLEHLATFSVGKTHNILKPSDGLDKLWQMEKKTGIWTQKMQMRLTKQWLIIIDFENGDVVERFPMQLISSPMAFTGTDPKELYNNILIFIVKEDAKNKNISQSEMHIFQCVQVMAQEVVKDMNLFMSGKWKSVFKDDNLPPPPQSPAPAPPMNGVNMKRQASRYSVAHSDMLNARTERLDSRASPIYNNRDSIDETSSTSSEKYEKEVGILNHCFDDIEQFIAWLQSAAAAYRELERRKKDRKSKKKDHGDGMLSMRAKPPPERDFVDVFQKFKLSFNLLAKLKAHIHDPNAPELVHFLFTPLALIVDASRDSNYGPNLASKVVSPLLTREAVELLSNCLTSKESDLWHSLGEAWVISRDMWSGYVAPYHPTFRDGYSPEYPFSEERERAEKTASAAAAAALASRVQREENMRPKSAELRKPIPNGRNYPRNYFHDGDHVDHLSSPEDHHRSFNNQSPNSNQGFADDRSDISVDSIEKGSADPHWNFERQQQQWLEELKARGARIVEVIFPRTANNDKELTVYRGEYLQILDSSRQWWKARNSRGQVAHVPNTIVTEYQMDDEPDSPNRSTDGSASGELPERSAPPIPPPAPQAVVPPPRLPPPPEWNRETNTGRKGEFRYF